MKRLALVILLAACSSSSSSNPPPAVPPSNDVDAGAAVELYAVIDLPRTGDTQSLSGTYYDVPSRTLYAISDRVPQRVPITIAEDLKSAKVGAPIPFTGRPETDWDGEGLARRGTDILALTVETAPTLERFTEAGAFVEAVALPAYFASQHPGNKGIESLGIAPDTGALFVANEAALTTDGELATKTTGTTIRIYRREPSGEELEIRYTTEPLGAGTGGDMGVSDVLPLTDDRLLVLERGYQSDFGNTVRIFAADMSGTPKKLVVDLSTLPSDGITNPGLQPNAILDNYEAMSLGPKLDDGRQIVFVTSDDNARATEVARILVLALRL